MRILLSRVASLFLFLGLTSVASAQPFRLLVTQPDVTAVVNPGVPIPLNAPAGGFVTARVTGTYTGIGQILIEQTPVLAGPSSFTATFVGGLPLNLRGGASFSIDVRYQPTAASATSAQVSLSYTEVTAGAAGADPVRVPGTLTLTLTGTSPAFTLSYLLPTDQNVVPIPPNGTLEIPAAPLGAVTQAALNVSNTGSGSGAVTGIALLSGAAFRLSRIPLFPFVVPSGQSLPVLVLYEPTGALLDTGQLRVTFEGGRSVLVNLEGRGVAARFSYELIQTDPPVPIPVGGSIELPSVNIGQTSSVLLRVTNTGNAAGAITTIGLAGAGFALADLPLLPQTMPPNTSVAFAITFTPPRPGTLRGALVVNGDRLTLNGVGLGAQLAFSYRVGGTLVTIEPPNGSLFFSPVPVGSESTVSLAVSNTGTIPATISSIGVGQPDGPFGLAGLPPLPLSLAPGQELAVPIAFRPVTAGFSSGTIRFDNTVVNLVGSATAPPPLPGYTISGPSGAVAPGQSLVSLTLDAPYPVALTGTLTLNVSGPLPADPAAQFATGGTTVRFVIPANRTQAVFGTQGNAIGLQTGTVANTLTLVPSFATQAGSADLTPASPRTLQFSVAPARPVIFGAAITSRTADSLVLTITGFSTTRTLTSLAVEFTAATGVQLASPRVTIDLQGASALWFRSSASQAFGGQFTLAIPFSFQGTPLAGQSVVANLTSLSAAVSNEVGGAPPVSVRIQ